MLAAGQSVGRYVIESVLGVGGMGSVYRATDVMLRRSVALKVVVPQDAGAMARFLREARAAAALQHPNIVAVYDVGEDEGRVFLAMELVEGESLREVIADPSRSFATRLGWLVDIAKALAVAHEKGFIHRDVKPDNVLLAPNGTAKLLDFGIAKQRDPGPSSFRTKTGDLFGTPDYMAPEQWTSSDVDAHADQYAWGMMAYEVLSRRALPARQRPLPLQSIAPEVPDAVAACITKAFAHAHDNRHADMNAIIALLEPFCAARDAKATETKTIETKTGDSVTPPTETKPELPIEETKAEPKQRPRPKERPAPSTAPSKLRLFATALALTVVIALVAGGVVLARRAPEREEVRQVAPIPASTSLPDASTTDETDAATRPTARSNAPAHIAPSASSSAWRTKPDVQGEVQVSLHTGYIDCTINGAHAASTVGKEFDAKRNALADCMKPRFAHPSAAEVRQSMMLDFDLTDDGSITTMTSRPIGDSAAACAARLVRPMKFVLPTDCTHAHAHVELKSNCVCLTTYYTSTNANPGNSGTIGCAIIKCGP